MAQVKRRYTTVRDGADYIVTATYDEAKLDNTPWFEAQIEAMNEATKEKMTLPREIKTYRIGEVEHNFKEIVRLDFGGDRTAAIDHWMMTIYRRVYQYIERGH